MSEICYHIDDEGYSTLVLPKKHKYVGLYGAKIKCYCTKCHKTVEIQESEYKEIIKEGTR